MSRKGNHIVDTTKNITVFMREILWRKYPWHRG